LECAKLHNYMIFDGIPGMADGSRTHDDRNHKTRPDTRSVTPAELDLVRRVARERGSTL